MNKMKRALAAVVAVLTIPMSLAGCNSNAEDFITVDGKKIPVPYVLKIDDYEVKLDEYRAIFNSGKNYMDETNASKGESVPALEWETDKELLADLRKQILDQLQQDRAIETILTENKVTLTEEDTKIVEEQIASIITQVGDEAKYEEELKAMGMTKDEYRKLIERSVLVQKLMALFADETSERAITDEAAKAYTVENTPHVKHILILSEGEVDGDKKKIAEEVLKKAKAGDDFDALVTEYGEDPGMEQSPEGYYIKPGQMVPEFEEASYALKVDEVSEIVTTSYGYHVIKRFPIEDSYYTDEVLSQTKQYMGSATLQEEVDKIVEGQKTEFTPQYEMITPNALIQNEK